MYWEEFPVWVKESILELLTQVKVVDVETFHHCSRVGTNSRLLARAAGLSEYDQKILEFSGLLHDIGKSKISPGVLLKPGRLDDDEMKHMKDHPVLSAEMMTSLTNFDFFKEVFPGVLHHHERLDGLGYPHGLEGDQIPLSARIVLIADTFDAMTSDRSYRKGLNKEAAFAELKKFSGQQFDPHLVQIFLSAFPFFERELEQIKQKENKFKTKLKVA